MKDRILFIRGIELFNRGEFFEAHETWEKLWRAAAGRDERMFFQGMIMIAAGLHHYRKQEYAGMVRLIEKGTTLLKESGYSTALFDKEMFLAEVRLFYVQFTSGAELYADAFPRIRTAAYK
ncbi:MAG: DUF309 domain-containing protein [Nitrospirota bacterium]